MMDRWAIVVALLATMILSSSCVKEDRSGVPCCLTVYLDEADPEGIHLGTVLTTGNDSGMVSRDTLVIEEHIEDGFEVFVPKGCISLSSLTGLKGTRFRDRAILAPAGTMYDRIFAYSNNLECVWDTEHDSVVFTKQHSVITLMTKEPITGYYPFDMRLRGNSCGMDIYTMEPVSGVFDAYASRNRDGTLTVVVPRQFDSSLVLDIISPSGFVDMSFQLGRMIEASGFDWSKSSLDDIEVRVDYASMSITVKVISWENEDKGVIII